MNKAYELSEKIVREVNTHVDNFKTDEFKDVVCEDMIGSLDTIIKDGVVLYKYLLEKKFYEHLPQIAVDMNELAKLLEKLSTNEENAKKLDFKNSIQLWNQAMLITASLACDLLDFRDNLN